MSQRIFHEPEPGVVTHTQLSRLLTTNVHVRDYMGTICNEIFPAVSRTVDALQKWPNTSNGRQECGYVLAHGKSIQQTLDDDLEKHRRYDSAMGAFPDDRTQELGLVIDGYDWAALGKANVVDVGGGIGTVSIALAKAYPNLSFVVEDRKEVIENAIVPAELNDRIDFLEHDFFTEQPVKNADVYFIRRVFMEWPDDKALSILKALVPALEKGARILAQDSYVPEPRACLMWQERRYRGSDMLLISLKNSGTRELEDWKELFSQVGDGLEYKGIIPVKNPMCYSWKLLAVVGNYRRNNESTICSGSRLAKQCKVIWDCDFKFASSVIVRRGGMSNGQLGVLKYKQADSELVDLTMCTTVRRK